MYQRDPDMKPRSKEKHNTPRRLDVIYIEGKWKEENGVRTWIKANRTRVHGMVTVVDRDCEEATVVFQDHPYADKDEPKVVYLSFGTFFGRWDDKRECFVLTDDLF